MVLRHFNLREQPFGVTADPRYLYATATHREALAALLHGIESGLGFISLIASPGMGKTTVLSKALARLGDSVRTVFLFQSIQTPTDLFRALLIDLGEKDPRGSLVDLETRLNEILVEQSKTGKRLVVVLDEAQNLDFAVLEAVRMLSNFESPSRKLLQIVLCGQLQLAERLAEPDLLQLRQRISIFACLRPLSATEVESYIQHRLTIAGYESPKPLFTAGALELIARHSQGIPRNINNICFNALTIGCALGKRTIDAQIVLEVIGDLKVQKVERNERIAITEAETPDERPSFGMLKLDDRAGLRVAAFAATFVVAAAVTVGGLVLARSGSLDMSRFHLSAATGGSAPLAAAITPREPVPVPAQSSTDASPLKADLKAGQAAAAAPASLAEPAQTAGASQAGDTKGTSPTPPGHGAKGSRRKKAAAVHARPATKGSQVQLVEAHKTESLNDLCTEEFGKCQPALLHRIIELNPQIANPSHVESGRRVVIPEAASSPAAGRTAQTGG